MIEKARTSGLELAGGRTRSDPLAAHGGQLTPGFDLVAVEPYLEARIKDSDVVVTGEGHRDGPRTSIHHFEEREH